MKRAVVLLLLLFPSIAAFAQYPPPRDVRDAVRMLQDVQRSLEPMISAIRDDTAVLAALAKAEKALKDAQPMTSFDEAEKAIKDFADHREHMESQLSRDLQKTIDEASRILAENRGLNNVAQAREKLHHTVLHPLQRQVIRNIDQLQTLTQQLQFMAQRAAMPAVPEALSAATYASTDVP